MPQPLPVRLVAVADVRLMTPAGAETALDAFYVGLLGFRRDAGDSRPAYEAENASIRFDVLEPPIARRDMRTLGIEIQSLADAEQKLVEAELVYERRRGITPGQESLLMTDPAGNWVELVERRIVQ